MSSEARLTRSAMRTRASRGVAADFLELPATPSRTRATGKTPGKTPCKAAIDSRQPFDEISSKASNGGDDVCQTPAVKDFNTLSDLERLLMSPTPRLTPETTSKAHDVGRMAEKAAVIDAAAVRASKPQVAAAMAAAQTASMDASSEQAAAAEMAVVQAAAGELSRATAQRTAEQQDVAKAAAADEAAAAAQRLAVELQAAADIQAAAQAAAVAERDAAAKVAAEVQAAADAALMAAELQAAEAQSAAAQAEPLDVVQGTDELAAVAAPTPTPGQAGGERWDVDADNDTVCNSDDDIMQQQQAPPRSVIKSKIVPTATFEPRSIRQLKKEIKARYAEQADLGGLKEDGIDETEEESAPSEGLAAVSLADALGGLSIGTNTAVGPLRGVPVAQGNHLRFDDDGAAEVGSPIKLQLRGMPQAAGKHLRFD